MRVIKVAPIILAVPVVIGFAVLLFHPPKEIVCKSSSEVIKITELNYRDATVLMANGEYITVNQATLKIGDTYCYEYSSKWGD